MVTISKFLQEVGREFPDDRLTYQKSIPTFHPDSAVEAARFVKLANRMKQPLFITGFGNNIDPVGEPFSSMVTIRTDRLNKLIEIAPEDFYVKLGGGYPLRELNKHLAERDLFNPISKLGYVGSVGGAVAVNLTGFIGNRKLPMKKYLIMAEIVTPEGEIVKPGSVCFKSVSGYDIVKLYASSWGLLGLVVTATLRILPLSAEHEYAGLTMNKVNRNRFLEGLLDSNSGVDAVYSRKVKAKFDPQTVFPIV